MVKAYLSLHEAGYAHSVEIWQGVSLIGGLYCVNLGAMVFGESMFSHQSNTSKIALAALVAFCRSKDISMIDCQQNTGHLASLGAGEISRNEFMQHLVDNVSKPSPTWEFDPLYWERLLPPCTGPMLP
ncbi:MAG: Leucyltransferase [Polaromonas sp.]|nr:Leucyltransferase [Polaromonas sp.]